jgi:hypothetical protein
VTDISTFDKESPKKNSFRRFTPWVPWAKRAVLVDDDGCRIDKYGGVYLLATFTRAPKSGPADHLDPAIFYVGEAGKFGQRWYAHDAFTRELDRLRSTAHVAAFPVWLAGDDPNRSVEPWTRTFRLYVERRILWEITLASNGTRRLLNRR